MLELRQKYDLIKEIRGKGLMIAIEFKGTDDHPTAKIHEQLFNRGYLASLRRGDIQPYILEDVIAAQPDEADGSKKQVISQVEVTDNLITFKVGQIE